jgi:CRISPR/Cas system-associated exonuclease Cas4 (RecB family)
MINIRHVRIADDKQQIFSEVNPDEVTWVVADVQSRSFLQGQLLDQYGQIEESSVVIANELWKELLFLSEPEYRLISEDLARSLIWEWVKPLRLPWAKTPASARRILQMLDHLSPILAHQGNEALLAEWFRQNPESVFRWQHWFEVGKRIWAEFESRKWALTVWIPALLVQTERNRPKWHKKLVFDLGVRVSPVEVQLIRELGRAQDIEVIIPKPEWADSFVTTCEAYRILEDTPDKKSEPMTPELVNFSARPRYRRFSTHLAEVKEATAQIREWLESGVKPSEIAIVSPDMEVYGSSLKIFLEEEGVSIQKASSEPLHSHPDIARWLSEIRLRINRFNKKDLEVYLFQDLNETDLPYDEFRRLFGRFYDVEDVSRWPELQKKLASNRDRRLTQREFLQWSLRLCPRHFDLNLMVALVSEFARDGILELELAVEVWLGMLEDLAARLTIPANTTDREGVYVLNLGSTEWVPATHICFLNASENVLRRWNDSPFSSAEANRLLKDLGFGVQSHEAQPSEFELCWLMNRPWKAVEFYFAGCNFSGEALTPSRFWLLGAHASGDWKSVSSPRATRWDDLQNSSVEAIAGVRSWSAEKCSQTKISLLQDAGKKSIAFIPREKWRLSASSIEQFQRCGFIFAAQKVFRLNDEPCLDLDLDRMSRGRLMHRMFSHLTAEPFQSERSDDELLQLIDLSRQEEKIQFGDEQMWPPIRQTHLRLARQFLTMEAEWRARFPKTKTVAAEQAFKCSWNAGDWIGGEEGPVIFSGRIDRVDSNGAGQYALIDYKSSVGNLRNWNSWVDNDQLQLAIYTDLLERGLTPLEKGLVEAAVYYVCKAGSRNKGFYLKESSGDLFAIEPRMRNVVTSEKRSELLANVRSVVGTAVEKISKGELTPSPKNLSSCEECAWNRMCRAPHLN